MGNNSSIVGCGRWQRAKTTRAASRDGGSTSRKHRTTNIQNPYPRTVGRTKLFCFMLFVRTARKPINLGTFWVLTSREDSGERF